ncbi:hypothetical protein ACHWQZ_G009617 [Mnemiopsis leidyi]
MTSAPNKSYSLDSLRRSWNNSFKGSSKTKGAAEVWPYKGEMDSQSLFKSVNACGESQVVVVSRLPAISVSVLLTDWLRN